MLIEVPAMRLTYGGRQVLDGPELEKDKTAAEKTTASRLARAVRKACKLRWRDVTHGSMRTAVELNASIYVLSEEAYNGIRDKAFEEGRKQGLKDAGDKLTRYLTQP